MRSEDIRAVLREQPFRRATIHVADGRALAIPHPEWFSIMPTNRTAVLQSPSVVHHLDLMLITGIERTPVDDVDPFSPIESQPPA